MREGVSVHFTVSGQHRCYKMESSANLALHSMSPHVPMRQIPNFKAKTCTVWTGS